MIKIISYQNPNTEHNRDDRTITHYQKMTLLDLKYLPPVLISDLR